MPRECELAAASVMSDEILDLAILGELEELDRSTGGGFLSQIVDVFVDQGKGLLDELRGALDDDVKLAALAHKLKGSARTVGAAKLGQSCERLEHEARGNRVEGASEQVAQICADFEVASTALRARLP